MVRDVFALVFPTSDEWWVEDGSGLGVGRKHPVHLRMLGVLGGRKGWSPRGSSLGDMGVDGMTVSRCCRRGVVGNGVEVDHGIWVTMWDSCGVTSPGEALSRCSASWYIFRSCAGSLDGGGWNVVGRGSGWRDVVGPDGVGVGVVV